MRRNKAYLTAAALACLVAASSGWAGVITFTGAITQSTSDGTGPAVNNPALNGIIDGDAFIVTLTFPGSIIPTLLPNPNFVFADNTHPATESSFSLLNLSIVANTFYDFSFLGCLSTGSGCAFGNQLTANFQIPAAALYLQNIAVTPLDQPHPLDLLEDDGTTEIQGGISAILTIRIPQYRSPRHLFCWAREWSSWLRLGGGCDEKASVVSTDGGARAGDCLRRGWRGVDQPVDGDGGGGISVHHLAAGKL